MFLTGAIHSQGQDGTESDCLGSNPSFMTSYAVSGMLISRRIRVLVSKREIIWGPNLQTERKE